MTTTTDFPQLDLRGLKLRDKLMEIPPTNLFVETIGMALRNNKPLEDVCKMIQQAYIEDQIDVRFMLGDEILELIKTVYHGTSD